MLINPLFLWKTARVGTRRRLISTEYIGKYTPPLRGGLSSYCIWGENIERGKRKCVIKRKKKEEIDVKIVK
jgi:hypothetical protein